MTAFETWVSELVKVLVGDLEDQSSADFATAYSEGLADRTRDEYSESWRKLGQRAAVLLVQARAQECRHLAGELLIQAPNNPLAVLISKQCWDRNHKLEAIGLQIAQPNGYPIPQGHETMVCRCAIDHGESKISVQEPLGNEDGSIDPQSVESYYVCSHCKLPKRGTAAPGPVLVQ